MHLRDSIRQAARKLEDWRAVNTGRDPDVSSIIAELLSVIPQPRTSPEQFTDSLSRLNQVAPD